MVRNWHVDEKAARLLLERLLAVRPSSPFSSQQGQATGRQTTNELYFTRDLAIPIYVCSIFFLLSFFSFLSHLSTSNPECTPF